MADRKPRRRGPVPKKLDADERAEFLRLRRAGVGQRTALFRMGVGYARLRRTLADDAEFRDEARAADEYLIEQLVTLRLKAAIDGDERAQEFLIGRHDRGRQFAATMRARRAELTAAAAAEKSGVDQAEIIAEAAIRAEKRRVERDRQPPG